MLLPDPQLAPATLAGPAMDACWSAHGRHGLSGTRRMLTPPKSENTRSRSTGPPSAPGASPLTPPTSPRLAHY